MVLFKMLKFCQMLYPLMLPESLALKRPFITLFMILSILKEIKQPTQEWAEKASLFCFILHAFLIKGQLDIYVRY